jgi:hypothetical protein
MHLAAIEAAGGFELRAAIGTDRQHFEGIKGLLALAASPPGSNGR